MENLESPYVRCASVGIGLSTEHYTERKINALWEKVDEIVDYINEKEKEDKKKNPE